MTKSLKSMNVVLTGKKDARLFVPKLVPSRNSKVERKEQVPSAVFALVGQDPSKRVQVVKPPLDGVMPTVPLLPGRVEDHATVAEPNSTVQG
jgi:hypothetical protein